MINEIKHLNQVVLKPSGLQICNISPDTECEDYFGFNFKMNDKNIKFRKSKLTPKKAGQFVTFWKRNRDGKTVPFNIHDGFDFYIIYTEELNNAGFFIFPKTILEKQNLISGKMGSGKRGFRIYADWHFPESKQATETKRWQTQYFSNVSSEESVNLENFKMIFTSENP